MGQWGKLIVASDVKLGYVAFITGQSQRWGWFNAAQASASSGVLENT